MIHSRSIVPAVSVLERPVRPLPPGLARDHAHLRAAAGVDVAADLVSTRGAPVSAQVTANAASSALAAGPSISTAVSRHGGWPGRGRRPTRRRCSARRSRRGRRRPPAASDGRASGCAKTRSSRGGLKRRTSTPASRRKRQYLRPVPMEPSQSYSTRTRHVRPRPLRERLREAPAGVVVADDVVLEVDPALGRRDQVEHRGVGLRAVNEKRVRGCRGSAGPPAARLSARLDRPAPQPRRPVPGHAGPRPSRRSCGRRAASTKPMCSSSGTPSSSAP